MRRAAAVMTSIGLIGLVWVPGAARAAFPGRNGRIAFDTDTDPHSQIFTIRPDGNGILQLTHLSGGRRACQPRWSADGSKIVYVVDGTTGDFCDEDISGRIWVMNADGSGQHKITHDPGFNDTGPAWSPDGEKIVFSRCAVPFGFNAYCDIAVVNADGTGMTTLLGGNWLHNGPSYSPDGKHIVFSSNRGGFIQAVWVMNSHGGALRRLTEPALQASGPEWSPDGSKILFDTIAGIPGEIVDSVWVMRADGNHPRLLVDEGLSASYSPNGRKIVLLSGRLSVANADGTGLHTIVPDPDVFFSDWQPKVTP